MELSTVSFMKFQSVGNDFITIDLHNYQNQYVQNLFPSITAQRTVTSLCSRRTGIGADCVLIIVKSLKNNDVDLLVYNADGSSAKNCLNGIRTVAHYLYSYNAFGDKTIIGIGNDSYVCTIKNVDTEEQRAEIVTSVKESRIIRELTITVLDKQLNGWYVSVGNPHFVVMDQPDSLWLDKYGAHLQLLPEFPEGVNVEFVNTEAPYCYSMSVYERGCGMTYGCSSGVAAAIRVLKETKKVEDGIKISIRMKGGTVCSSIDSNGVIFLQAYSYYVFNGNVELPIHCL